MDNDIIHLQNKTMITVQQLQTNGYTLYINDLEGVDNEFYQGSYQKQITDDDRIKFFLRFDAYYYEKGDLRFSEDIQNKTFLFSAARLEANGIPFLLEASIHNQSLEEIEKWYLDVWKKLGCKYHD